MASLIKVSLSPSHVANNLTTNGVFVCHAHQHEVCIFPESALSASNKKPLVCKTLVNRDGSVIHHVRWIRIAQRWYLVLATSTGVQVFENDSFRLLFSLPLPPKGGVAAVACGIAAVPAAAAPGGAHQQQQLHHLLLIGLQSGGVQALSVRGGGAGAAAAVEVAAGPPLPAHHAAPVTCLASPGSEFAAVADSPVVASAAAAASTASVLFCSGDQAGEIAVWRRDAGGSDHSSSRATTLFRPPPAAPAPAAAGAHTPPSSAAFDDPVVSMAMRGSLLVAGFGSGLVRLLSCAAAGGGGGGGGALVAEVAAHAQYINALALHPTKDAVATVSDDSFVSVWSFAGFDDFNRQLKPEFSAGVPNGLLCGVVFADQGTAVAVASYDSTHISLFSNLKF